ncbi:MAG: hypothetical protein ACRD3A_02225 [Terriglobales bacterium]
MNHSAMWGRFATYLKWGTEFLFVDYFVLVTVAVLTGIAVTAFLQRPLAAAKRRRYDIVLVAPFMAVPLIALIAAVGAVPTRGPGPLAPPNTAALHTVDAVLICAAASWLLLLTIMKGRRWFVLSICLLNLWWLLGEAFIAGMALTGDWI